AIDARDLVEYVGTPRATSASAMAAPAQAQATARGEPAQADVYSWARQNNVSLRDLKRKIELDCITQALSACNGNITRAAERLGRRLPRLSQLLKEYGLSQGRPGTEDKP